MGNNKRLINTKLSEISKLQETNQGELRGSIVELQKEVDQLLEEEDTRWKQRTKQKRLNA